MYDAMEMEMPTEAVSIALASTVLASLLKLTTIFIPILHSLSTKTQCSIFIHSCFAFITSSN